MRIGQDAAQLPSARQPAGQVSPSGAGLAPWAPRQQAERERLSRLQDGARLPLQLHRLASLRGPADPSAAVVQCSHHITGAPAELLDKDRQPLKTIPAGYSLWVLRTEGEYALVAEYRGQDQEEEEDEEDEEGEEGEEDEQARDEEDGEGDDGQGSVDGADDPDEDAIGLVRRAQLLSQPAPQVPELGAVPRHWTQAPGRLVGSKGPRMRDVRQGDLNDCYLLAPLAAMACTPRGKQLIPEIIRDLGDGRVSARFATMNEDNEIGPREEVLVDRWLPSDKDGHLRYNQPQHSPPEKLPTWASLLEKAYAQWDPKGYAGLDMEPASRAIAHLTGQEPESLAWDTESDLPLEALADAWAQDTFHQEDLEDRQAADELEDGEEGPRAVKDIDADQLHALLRAARLDPNAMLVAESRSEKGDHVVFLDKEKEVRDSHVYVIQDVCKDQSLILWDPVESGTVRIKIDKFRRLFNRVLRTSLR